MAAVAQVREPFQGIRALAVAILLVPAAVGCGGEVLEPTVVDGLPWSGDGVWLAGDPHVHVIVDEEDISELVVNAAATNGLDFMAMTEHAQDAFDGQYAMRLEDARQRYPDLIVLAGIEWNMPGGHHTVVLTENAPGEVEHLADFSARFDRKVNLDLLLDAADEGTWGTVEQALDGLRWLEESARGDGPRSTAFVAHPSRHDFPSPATIARLAKGGLQGVEAGPGHQGRRRPGVPSSLDRYDPYIAVVGGSYDRLLADGRLLGITAGSDFHHDEGNYRPGKFSRSLVLCPDRSSAGIIAGLNAGATATVMGGIVDAVDLRVVAGEATARIAETIAVPVDQAVRLELALDVPRNDFVGRENRLDSVELIADYSGAAEVVHDFGIVGPGTGQTLVFQLPPGATSRPRDFFVRVRGRRIIGGQGHDLYNADSLFYTAPVRVVVKR